MANVQKNTNVKRYTPQVNFGLTNDQLNERIQNNLVNTESIIKTKTIPNIIKNNLFNYGFNTADKP